MKFLHSKSKHHLIFTLLIILLIITTGCGSSGSNKYAVEDNRITTEEGYDSYYDGGYYDSDDYDYDKPKAEIAELTKEQTNRKLIKTGDLEIHSKDVKKSYQFIIDNVKKYQGYETNIYQSESEKYLSITTTLAIPSERIDEFVDLISESENVKYISINTDDITDSYFDTETRLKNLEKSLDKYYEFFEKADNTEDMLAIQEKIDSTTTDIELLKGRLNLWDNQVNYSTLTISIYQEEDLINIDRKVDFSAMTWDEVTYYLRISWMKMLNRIVAVLQWLFIILLVIAPIVIPILIIVFVIIHSYKKKRAKQNIKYEDQFKQQSKDQINQQNNDDKQ